MSGYNTVRMVHLLEKECDELGFKIASPNHGYYNNEYGDLVSVMPKDSTSLPIYCRDAELFVGTLEDLRIWLSGIEWARSYDMLLRLSDDKKRKRKEQDELNRQLVKRLKDEKFQLKDRA